MPISNLVQKKPNQFDTPLSRQSAGTTIGGTLARNTRPFNPATVGTFDTTPKLATPSMGLIQPSGKTPLGGSVATPQAAPTLARATPQPLAISSANTDVNPNASFNAMGGVPTPGYASPQPTQQNQQFQSPVRGLFSDVVTSLANRSLQPSAAFTQAQSDYAKANTELANYKTKLAEQMGAEELRAIPLEFVQGRQQVLQRQGESGIAARESARESAATRQLVALQQQGLEQQALQSAAGFAPEATRFSAFGGGGESFDPQTTAQQYARDVISGARTYDDAVSAMGLYGGAGKQFLDQAIRTANPNFNFAQSQSFADTQGKVGPQYQFATQALSNVENALQSLSNLQKTNVPLWNQFTNFASLQSGLGAEQTRQFVGAVQSLRNAYAAILASAKGGLPSDYSNQAIAEVPDIPTANDLAAIRHNLETLGQARLGTFGQPGNVTNTQSSTGSVGWF